MGGYYGRLGQNPRTCQPYPSHNATEACCLWQVNFDLVPVPIINSYLHAISTIPNCTPYRQSLAPLPSSPQQSPAITTCPKHPLTATQNTPALKHFINTNPKFTCHTMWPCSPFYGWLLWQARPKSPHLPAITLPDCYRRQPPMAGDFRLGARYLHAISAVPSTPPQLTPTITCHNNTQQNTL